MGERTETDVVGARPSPFFIMGSPRSGTTLAAQILDAHSRLAVYLEMNYYPTFRPTAHLYGDLRRASNRRRFISDVVAHLGMQRTNPPGGAEIERALVAPTFEGVLETILRLQALGRGKNRGGEKTPLHFMFLAEILSGFPDSPVLFLMRDPRDVVLSMRKAWNASIDEAARVWNQAFLTLTDTPSTAVHLVRYEELVHDPVGTSQAMCRALGEAFEPEMLESPARVPDHLQAIRHLDLTKLSGPVVSSSVGSYKELSTDEIRAIETACALGMETMGYEFAAATPAIVRPIIKRPGTMRLCFDRLQYYGVNRERWRRGVFRWRMALRVRARYLASLRFLGQGS